MKRKVTYAKLHDLNIVVPGVGGLGKDLPPANKTIAGMEMFYTSEGLLISIKGREHMVPLANVQFVSLAPEPKVEAEEPKAKK